MSDPIADPIPAKREERWFLVRLATLFLVTILVFVLLMSLRSRANYSKYPRVKLSDGTWLVARSVTIGTSHPLNIPYPIDVQFRRWQRAHHESHSTQSNRMVVWLTHENDRGEMLDLNWFGRCKLIAADDYQVNPEHYHRQTNQPNSSSGAGTGHTGYTDANPFGTSKKVQLAVVRFDLPMLRPKDGAMKLDVYDGTGQVVAQLSLPYPELKTILREEWQPDPLPASRSDGNLNVTLTSVDYKRYQSDHGIQVSPRLEFSHDGQPSTAWVVSHELQDLLGNVARTWNCDLSPHEPAWKVRLTMHQSPAGRFLPEEVKRLPPKPLPAAKQVTFLTGSHTVNEIPVSLVGLGGQGPIQFTLPNSSTTFKTGIYHPGQSSMGMSSSCSGNVCDVELSSGHPFLMTSESQFGTDGNIQIVVRDQSGEVLPARGNSSAQGLTFWFFEPLPTSTSIEIEIIAQKCRHAEFLIAPPKPEDITLIQ
jgi:hypothetical protein